MINILGTYLTGVVAPEPPRDEQFCPFGCVGDVLDVSLPAVVACETNQASTTWRVAFLQKRNKNKNETKIKRDK